MSLLAHLGLAVQLASQVPAPAAVDSVSLGVAPAQVYIEAHTSQQLDLDLLVVNDTPDTLNLEKLQLSVLDRQGRLVLRRFIRGPGMNAMLPTRRFAPGATGMLFNPFHSFDPEIELATLRYELEFSRLGSAARLTAETTVRPAAYRPRTDLILPVAGRLIADDGHDFFFAPSTTGSASAGRYGRRAQAGSSPRTTTSGTTTAPAARPGSIRRRFPATT
jgi:hypothetical protein